MPFPWLGIFFWVGLFTWFSIIAWTRFLREQERQQTLRAFAESGRPLDAETMEMVCPKPGWQQQPPAWSPKPGSAARGLLTGGIIMLFAGAGILIGAQLVGRFNPHALWGMSTAGVMVGCIALGLITASIVMRRMAERDKHALLDKTADSR